MSKNNSSTNNNNNNRGTPKKPTAAAVVSADSESDSDSALDQVVDDKFWRSAVVRILTHNTLQKFFTLLIKFIYFFELNK